MNNGKVITKMQWLKGNWTGLPNEVLFSTVLSQGAKLCCLAIAAHFFSGDSKTAWPGQTRLGRILHVKTRAVRNYLEELKDVQLIQVKQRGNNQSNIYYLCEPNAELLKPMPLSLTPTAKSGGPAPGCQPDRHQGAYKEEEDRNDDAEFSKENSLSSKKQTNLPICGLLDRFKQLNKAGNDE